MHLHHCDECDPLTVGIFQFVFQTGAITSHNWLGQILKMAFYLLDFIFTQSILEFDLLREHSWCRFFPTAPNKSKTKNRFVLNPFFTAIREVDRRIKEVGHRYQGSMTV